jgi:zinc protease
VYQRDSIFYQAMEMGSLHTSGLPYDSGDLQARKLREITAEQVRDVARRYLVDDTLTAAVLEPQPIARPAAGAAQ